MILTEHTFEIIDHTADLGIVAAQGAAWAIKQGYGSMPDLEKTEDRGTLAGADPSVRNETEFRLLLPWCRQGSQKNTGSQISQGPSDPS